VGPGSEDPESYAILRLPARPESAAAGRRFIAKTLAGWGLALLSDSAVLLGNELVTNALIHARSAVEIELRRNRVALRVAVHDRAVTAPARRFYGLEASSGRGLAMVEALASDWGVTLRPPGGKTVWFELALPDAGGPRLRRRAGPARPTHPAGPAAAAGATG
jgi:anti-sigma regulatory factor (Ser/Thr protein kinase)